MTTQGKTVRRKAGADDILVRAACPHDCPDTCALHVLVRDGRAVRVSGDPDHPTTRGTLCTKVARYLERTYHPDRLTVPMRRRGPKGAGEFEPISWEAAIDEIATRLREIHLRRPESILPYSFAGTMGWVQREGMASRLFHRLGATRLERGICASAGTTALAYTMGASVGMDMESFIDSRLVLIWGSNSITSNLHFWSIAREAKRRGARLVAIDPLRTETAARCDDHLAIRPGTDAALALSMAHVLIAEDRLDHDYIERYTTGFEAFARRAAEYPPARAAAITGIEADRIVELARAFATTRPAAIRLNYGMQRVRGGSNAVRAVACLPALVGAWRDAAGGFLLSSGDHVPTDNNRLLRPDLTPGWPHRLPRVINMSAIGDALLEADPPIEAIVVYNANPVAVAPDSNRVIAGFSREDLFTVVLEHFLTDTADYADILLPATTQLEHFDLHKTYGHRYIVANNPAIAPVGQALPNSEIFRRIARAIGFEDEALRASDEEIAADAVRWDHPALGGATLDDIRRKGWIKMNEVAASFANGNFPTPSGRFEFASERLAAQGLDPVPDWLPPHESPEAAPELAARYPLALISPPHRNFMNSTFVNIASLSRTEGEPFCDIHVEDAAARGIADGDRVRVYNDRGAVELVAKVGDRVRPGVVAARGIWWHRMSAGGRNVNATTSQALTDMGGGATFYDCLVEVDAIG